MLPLFVHFHPHIFLMLFIMLTIQWAYILDIDECETIQEAYPRYVKGQYGVQIHEDLKFVTSEELRMDIFK